MLWKCVGPLTNERTASNEHHVGDLCTVGLDATVTSSHVLSVILKKVYIPCKISTQLDQELDEVCRTWPQNLPPVLHWRRASPENRRQATAILHANLVYCHSLILLTRPFFLLVLSEEVKQERVGGRGSSHRQEVRMKEFFQELY